MGNHSKCFKCGELDEFCVCTAQQAAAKAEIPAGASVRDMLRWSQANTDYHGLIAFTQAQFDHFVSMVQAAAKAPAAQAVDARNSVLPCPFCGNADEVYGAGNGLGTYCDNCGADGPSYERDGKPVATWNDRASPASTPEASQQAAPFPERDQSKPAEQQGLFRKFDVRRVDGSDQPGGKHYGCRYYVLDLNHDQHAPAAMRAYAAACRVTHPQLADDIDAEFGIDKRAAAVAAPSEQQANVLPPTRGTGSQLDASEGETLDQKAENALLWCYRRLKNSYGRLPFVEEAVAGLRERTAAAGSARQGGNTNTESCSAGAATTSEDAWDAALVEKEAEKIYSLFEGAKQHPWVKGGNSNKQDEARRLARSALAMRATQQEGE